MEKEHMRPEYTIHDEKMYELTVKIFKIVDQTWWDNTACDVALVIEDYITKLRID